MDGMGEDEIEDLVPRERRQSNLIGAIHGDTDWQVAGDDPRWIAHIENAVRTGIEHEAATLATYWSNATAPEREIASKSTSAIARKARRAGMA